jgi:7,8-dihydropterin-6-yl-methyl-4-(beta-D-ribofuranosyl)aminobenzene 5'-phosphate synthase
MKKITCVVDNSVQRSSLYWGEHGVSFWLETDQGCALFDTGRSGSVLFHNLEKLGINPQDVDALILSHAHNDHTGGVKAVLSKMPGLPLFASPDIFRPRFSLRDGEYKSIGMPITENELTRTATLCLDKDPQEVLPGLWTSGEISERPEQEGRSTRHFVPQNDAWRPDPYRDDLSMVMDTHEGLVVICGCCHAGLLNTLAHIRRVFKRPIIAVMGGTHLTSADDAYLGHVVNELQETYGSLTYYLNHCTGERAYVALANACGEQVKLCPVGTKVTFDDC